eukprot:TRINITY_DN8815_c0_g1_i1.p1 TRINITY_DN8815_c0_g1~~TRINITY_DN8815_c0_g1_i1.p1  ORF type:complete len:310 (-),score=57.98 TRINITY_DN8815_c0_g1_i1:943-1872(-)
MASSRGTVTYRPRLSRPTSQPDPLKDEIASLFRKTDQYRSEFMHVEHGSGSAKRRAMEQKLLVRSGDRSDRNFMTAQRSGKMIELKSIGDDTRSKLSIQSLKRQAHIPAAYVLSFLQIAAAQSSAQHGDSPQQSIDEIARNDPVTAKMLQEAMADVNAAVHREHIELRKLPAPEMDVQVVLEKNTDAPMETFKKRTLAETAASVHVLYLIALSGKAWEDSGRRYRERASRSVATQQGVRASFWQNDAFQSQLSSQAAKLGLAIDAQQKRISHLEYMRFLNYKQDLQETEDILRQRNLLADVDLHSDEDD